MEEHNGEIKTGQIFRESVELLKARPSIVVPFLAGNLIASIVFLLTVGLFLEPSLPSDGLPKNQFFIAFIVGMALQSMAFGMATLMAWNQISRASDTIWDSFKGTLQRAFQLIMAGLLLGTSTALGIAFFILPGLLVAFVFMFTFVFIMVEDKHIFEAMGDSFILVKGNLLQSLKLFLLIVALSVVVGFIGAVVMRPSLFGQFLNALLVSVLFGLTATMVVVFYKNSLSEKTRI